MNNDYDFIKKFSKITISNICKNENIDRSNIFNGKSAKKNYKKVREIVEKEISNLYKRSDKNE